METDSEENPSSSRSQSFQSSQPLFSDKFDICPSPEEVTNYGVKLTEHLVGQGKFSAYAVNTDWFQDAMHFSLKQLGVAIPRRFMPSRRTVNRIIEKKADEEREITKKEIEEAKSKNPDIKFTLQFDDGLVKNGNKENVRAIAVGWHDPVTGINRRFLGLTEEFDKTTNSIRQTLKRTVEDNKIPDNFILLSDAASTNMSLTMNSNSEWFKREHSTCGDHMFHNGFCNGTEDYCRIDNEFKIFFKTIEKTLEKGSRLHLNQVMINVDGWRKLKGICKTRWGSVIDAVESILKNWDILADHPKAKKLPMFAQETMTKHDLQAFFNLIEPFRTSIKVLEGFHQSNGHLMAMELQNVLVFYVNYKANPTNPKMFRGLAGQFIKQCEDYFDGVPAQNGGYKKLKRIDSIRLLQAAFYLPCNMLNHFNPNVTGPVIDENMKKSMHQRYERLNSELQNFITNYETTNESNVSHNSSNSSLMQQSFTKSPLEMEVYQFTALAQKYACSPKSQWPSCLIQFDENQSNRLDANAIFWQSSYAVDTLPTLRKIICPLLAVSASTSLIEGTFSHVNQIRTAKRSRLLTKNLDNFLVLHYARTLR